VSLRIAVTAFVVLLLGAPSAPAAVSSEAGWGCTADSSKAGWTLLATPLPSSPYSPLVKETPGVIVHWNVRVGSGLSPLVQQLGVFRAVNGGADYTKVAESALETFGGNPEAEAFATRIPVQAGDYVGLHGPVETFVCGGQGGATAALFEGGIALGETKAFKTESEFRSPVSAVVEFDADGDGYGDSSQDRCPESALFQTECPLVALEIGDVEVKRGAILIEAGNNSTASIEAIGEVRWSVRPKSNHSAERSSKGKRVRVGLRTPGTQTVEPGAPVTLRVPLPESVKKRLAQLPRRRALQARIDVKATNLVPYVGTHELKIKLPGRKQP